ncbi:MAG: hypothetical protein BGO43_07870 [Gammaproteobacteria bacterium 39-13]|nr:hypothetical protein [Gammaproteobacteria bacterium]OJV93085.1 MAG: hypothetical protein BGO43_07870 [Gammaproteobacteria bacterium 39-13]
MAGDKNADSFRETIRNFRDIIKQQILTAAMWAGESKNYIKEKTQQAARWCLLQAMRSKQIIQSALHKSYAVVKESLQQAFQWTTYMLMHAPQFIARAAAWTTRLLVRGFWLGYELAGKLLNGCWQAVKKMAQGLKYIIVQLPTFLHLAANQVVKFLRGSFDFMKLLIKSTFNLVKSVIIGIKDFAIEVVKALGRLGQYLFNNAGPILRKIAGDAYYFIKHIPLFIKQLARIARDIFVFLKDGIVDIAKDFYHLGRIVLSHLGHSLKTLMTHVVPFTKWVANKTVSFVLKGIGLLLGIGAAIFELGIDVLKGLFGKKQAKPEIPNSNRSSHHIEPLLPSESVSAFIPLYLKQKKQECSESLSNDLRQNQVVASRTKSMHLRG